MATALESSVHTVTGLDVPTPSTGPSMSPNSVPSEMFNAELSMSSNVSLGEDEAAFAKRGGNRREAAYEAGSDPVADAVHDLVKSVAEDSAPRVVIAERCGISAGIAVEHVIPLLYHTSNTQEVVVVDLHDDDVVGSVCAAVYRNPTICSLVLVNNGRPGLTEEGIACVASLVSNCRHLVTLSLVNTLYSHVAHAMQLLGEAVARSKSLKVLNLEANAIDDENVLPLAQGLAGQRSLVEVYLDSNSLSHQGVDIMSEVMIYNETLEVLSLSRNLVRCVTDLWEGYFIQEQCKVNRELALLGRYTLKAHLNWPYLWRRKMRRMWVLFINLRERFAQSDGHDEETGDLHESDWEHVMQFLDPRGYVEQQVKLWMKLEPPQVQSPQLVRHT